MSEAVSIGTVYSSAELRLDGFNRQWDSAVAKIKGLQEKLDGLKFDPAKITAGTEGVDKGFLGLTETLKKAQVALQKLDRTEFKAAGILRGSDQAMRALGELAERTTLVSGRILDLSAKSTEAQGALRGLGTEAGSADKKIATLAGTTAAAATAISDTGKAGLDAGGNLNALGDGADLAKKSVSGLGRAATLTSGKLDTLSLAKFDPAGIVAGADEGIGALERLRLAAQGVKNSLRMAPALIGANPRAAGAGGRRLGGAALQLGGAAAGGVANVAAAVTVIGGFTVKNALDYGNMVQGVAGNTTMTPAQIAAMSKSVLSDMKSGTDENQLAQGYKHISNFGYKGPAADTIAQFGNRFGIATHSNVEETDDVLAGVMNAYKHMGPQMVPRVGNVIHYAAAGSNMDVKDLEKNSTRTVGLAANYMGPEGLPDVLAAYSALVQHRLNPARADTQISGMLGQIAAPSDKATAEAKKLGLKNFNASGLRRVQLTGVVNEAQTAIAGLPENDRVTALKQLFNNKQGGIGASFLTGAANATMRSALNDPKTGTKAAFAGKADAITPLYNAQMNTPAQKLKALSGTLKSDSIAIGNDFIPVLTKSLPLLKIVAEDLLKMVSAFSKLPLPVQQGIAALGLLKIASVALGNPLLGLGEGVGSLIAKLGGLEAGGAALEGLGAAAGPIGLVVAAVVAFGIAWKTNFGNIRGAFAPFLADVKQTFGGSGKAITDFVKTTLPDLKKFIAEVEPLFAVHFKILGVVVKVAFDLIKAVVKAALAVVLGVFRTVLALLTGDWKGAWAGIGSIFQGQMDAILGFAKDVSPKFVAWISQLGQDIKAGWIAALNGLKSAFSGGARELVDAFGAGLKNGIASVGPGIKAAASSLASLIPTSVRSVLQIHSPSRVMHEIGRFTSQGLADGISAGKSQVTAAMRGVVQSALKEANAKKAGFLIDHEARGLRAGGMSASDVADFRESAHAQLSGAGRGGHAAASQRHWQAQLGRLATVQDTPALKQYAAGLKQQTAMREQIHSALAALQGDPAEPTAAKKRATYANEYHAQMKGLGYDPSQPLLYTKQQTDGFAAAKKLLDEKLAEVQKAEDVKTTAATNSVQEDTDRLKDKAAEDKHPYDFQRDQAGKELGPNGSALKSGADPAKVAEDLRLRLAAIGKEESDDAKQAEDRKQQYLLSTQAISLAQYQNYLKTRLGDYHEYSSEWVQISQSINDIDLQLWKGQEDALQQKFDAGLIDLKDYISQMQALEATLPATADPSVRADVADSIARAQGKDKKASDKEMIGGDGFWKDLSDSAAEGGSHFLTALLHPKNRKSLFKSMQTDLMDSLEGGLTKGLAGLLKNLISGGGGGINLGALLGGGINLGALLGGGKKANPLAAVASGGTTALGLPIPTVQFGGGAGHGLTAQIASAVPLLHGLSALQGLSGVHGINGPVGGGPGGLIGGGPGGLIGGGPGGLIGGGPGGLSSLLGAASSFIPGAGAAGALASLLPSGVLSKLFSGGLFGGTLKKLFHFAKGTWSVPGHGSGDTVPSVLTPGEMVIPKAGAQLVREALGGNASGGASSSRPAGNANIHVTHIGDINNQADGERFHRDTAWHVQQRLATAV